jgi:hypothetical protein
MSADLKRLIILADGEQISRPNQVGQSGLLMKLWLKLGLPDLVQGGILYMQGMTQQILSGLGGRIEYDTI